MSNLSRFGMKETDYQDLLRVQGGVCALCHQPESRKDPHSPTGESSRLAVDHDHRSMLVRGLLCAACNRRLSYLEANARLRRTWSVAWCERAFLYLAASPKSFRVRKERRIQKKRGFA